MVKLKYEYLLPIGSVVKVKDIEKQHMIYGVLQKGEAFPDRVFDYVAVPYPEGLVDARLSIGFDHGDIEEIIFRGYENSEYKAFIILLEAISRKLEKAKRENKTE